AVQPDHSRRAARVVVCVQVAAARHSDSGRVRVAQSHQRAGDDRRAQLDLSSPLAERSTRRRAGSTRASGEAAGVGGKIRTAWSDVTRGRFSRSRLNAKAAKAAKEPRSRPATRVAT